MSMTSPFDVLKHTWTDRQPVNIVLSAQRERERNLFTKKQIINSTQLNEHVRTQVLTPQCPHLFNTTTYETTQLLLHVLIYLQFRSRRLWNHTRHPGSSKTASKLSRCQCSPHRKQLQLSASSASPKTFKLTWLTSQVFEQTSHGNTHQLIVLNNRRSIYSPNNVENNTTSKYIQHSQHID